MPFSEHKTDHGKYVKSQPFVKIFFDVIVIFSLCFVLGNATSLTGNDDNFA